MAARLIADHPDLNVLINNAGIMLPDQAAGRIDDKLMVDTVMTNLVGPIRMTSALVEHLKGKNDAVVAYTSSVLGFVPMAVTAVYSATKAALHSYALSQRFMLKDAGVRVLEIAPPWVRTDLMNSREAEQAMPLEQFVDGDDGRARHRCRRNPGRGREGVPCQRRRRTSTASSTASISRPLRCLGVTDRHLVTRQPRSMVTVRAEEDMK